MDNEWINLNAQTISQHVCWDDSFIQVIKLIQIKTNYFDPSLCF